jgi:cellulose synthase/poly-beta-1,6-N-acetylglucosamine synthase-like glycosyltransferase
VEYQPVARRRDRVAIVVVATLQLLVTAALLGYVLWPSHWPDLQSGRWVANVLSVIGLTVLVLVQGLVAFRGFVTTYFVVNGRDPIPMQSPPGLRVAVLTTIVPGKEPVDLVFNTLRAMLRLRHNGPLDVWLLDEGDSPEVRSMCEEIGVRHFSRKGVERWNQPTGRFKTKTKHGNHNSWRDQHAAGYDVVAQMDPDHVPYPHFLERTIGYFSDPDVGFVVAPQVYGNITESFVARGAAQMSYIFHGVTQRGGNKFGAPILIGTNHLYRPATFDAIGGYQDSIIEDHLTAMVVYATKNPGTGNHWKGVYTPDVQAVGDGPATYSDWFSQQKRWAYGMWEVIRQHSFTVIPKMPKRSQRVSFILLQTHYPFTGLAWLGGIFLFCLYLIGGISVTQLSFWTWMGLFLANSALAFAVVQMLSRFNLAAHERQSWNLTGMALDVVTGPVFCAAALAQLAGRPLVYVVTAKGSASTGDTWRTFRPHLLWLGVSAAAVLAGVLLRHNYAPLQFWAVTTGVICLAPMLHVAVRRATPVAVRRAVVTVTAVALVAAGVGSVALVRSGALSADPAPHQPAGGRSSLAQPGSSSSGPGASTSRVTFAPHDTMAVSQHITLAEASSAVTLTVPSAARYQSSRFEPTITRLRVTSGTVPITLRRATAAGSTTVRLGRPVRALDVTYAVSGAIARSSSSDGRSVALVTPFAVTSRDARRTTVTLDSPSVTNIGCSAADGESTSCGSRSRQQWSATVSHGTDLIAQIIPNRGA